MVNRQARPKKMIPKPGIIQIGADISGRPYVASKFGDYPYKGEKKDIEKRVVSGFIESLAVQKEKVQLVHDEREEPEHPDFICTDGRQEFGIELLELVTAAEITNRQITAAVRKKMGIPTLYLNVQTKESKLIEQLRPRDFQTLIAEIGEVVDYAYGWGGRICGDLRPFHTTIKELGFAYHTDCGVLRKVSYAIYFSIHAATGPQFTPIEQDYHETETKFTEKWLSEYGMMCWLLLYTFGVDYEFERLSQIIYLMNKQCGTKFAEVWFSRPYGLDDIEDELKSLYTTKSEKSQ